jgi:predicted nucleic acid-binding protein
MLSTIKEFMHVFDFIPESTVIWEKAGLISQSLRRKGKSIGLGVCFIAGSATSCGAGLFTLDRHFSAIRKSMNLSLFTPSRKRSQAASRVLKL